MDITALPSKKDQLAAQLTNKAPTGANVQRVSFARVLDGSRGAGNATVATAERAPNETVRSTRSSVTDTTQDERKGLTVRDYMDQARDPAQQPAPRDKVTQKEQPQAAAARETKQSVKPAETASTSNTGAAQAPSAETGQVTPTQGETSTIAVVGNPIPNTAAQAVELPAALLMASAPVTEALAAEASIAPAAAPAPVAPATTPAVPGIALAGSADDAAVPTLVAPLTKPAATGPAKAAPATRLQSTPGTQTAADPSATALVGALVGKVTARGQNQALGSQTDPAGKPQVAASETIQVAPAQAIVRPAVSPTAQLAAVAQPAGVEGEFPVTAEKALTSATLQPAQASEPKARATTVRGGEISMAATPNGLLGPNGDQTVPHNPNAGTNQPGMRPTTEHQALANAAAPADASLPSAQDHAALAARTAAEPVTRSLDAMKGSAEPAVQNVGATSGSGATSTEAAARAAAAKFARPATPAAPVAEQVAVKISKAAAQGTDRIEIRLKPASLGTVRVAMEVGHDGRVLAVVSADRAETLDMLKQDSRSLERALQDAGLKTDSNSLSFNLRGGDGRNPQAGNAEGGAKPFSLGEDQPNGDADPAAGDPVYYSSGSGLVDIHV